MTVREGTAWIYVGHGDGVGLAHLVTESRNHMVATWSEPMFTKDILYIPTENRMPYPGGFSWYGPVDEFLKVFKRC